MVYLDYAATTPVNESVQRAIQHTLQNTFGNPSSIHRLGKDSKRQLTKARERLAHLFGVKHEEIFFTTGEKYTKVIDYTEYLDEIFKTVTLSFVVAWGKLIKKILFNGENPIRFPIGKVAEDKFVTYLLAIKANKIVYIHEPNYYYRIRQGSITNSEPTIKRAADDILACETRMCDLVLTGYDISGAVGWYQYILELHFTHLTNLGLTNNDTYRKIKKKIALINKNYK